MAFSGSSSGQIGKRRKKNIRKPLAITPVHPPSISPESSIVLDVRLEGSVRPMHFPLLCTIRDIIEIIRQTYQSHISRAGIFVVRSGIWLKSSRYLYSYYLDDLEEVSVERKKNRKSNDIVWTVILPNEKQIEVTCSTTSTARGILQSIPSKPHNFIISTAFVTMEKENLPPKIISQDILLVKICDPSSCRLRISTPGVSWVENLEMNTNEQSMHRRRYSCDETNNKIIENPPKIREYPPFEDLVNIARQSKPSKISELETTVILTTRQQLSGSIGGRDVRLQILLELQEQTVTVMCDYTDKVQIIYQVLFEYLDINPLSEDSYGLYHPADRHRIPSYVTVKSTGVSSGDLCIFKHLFTTPGRSLPKKKDKRGTYRAMMKPNLWKPTIPAWFSKETSTETSSTSTTLEPPSLREIELSIFLKFIYWLEQKNASAAEGIFRISASATVVEEILENTLRDKDFDGGKYRVHEIAGAFKKYLREGKALFPNSFYQRIIDTHNGIVVDTDKLWDIVNEVPQSSLEILKQLLQFVQKIASFRETNKMGIDNLAIIFSPILLRDESITLDLGKTGTQVDITEELIHFGKRFTETKPRSSSVSFRETVECPTELPHTQLSCSSEILQTSVRERMDKIQNLLSTDSLYSRTTAIHSLQEEFDGEEILKYLQASKKEDIINLLHLLTTAAASVVPVPNGT